MGNYRNRLDVIADMLHVVRQGAKKTQIMYQANLSYELLIKYLAEIMKAYLVRFERREGCYMLTNKGKKFLKKYKEYSRRNRHVEKTISNIRVERQILEELCSNRQVKRKAKARISTRGLTQK